MSAQMLAAKAIFAEALRKSHTIVPPIKLVFNRPLKPESFDMLEEYLPYEIERMVKVKDYPAIFIKHDMDRYIDWKKDLADMLTVLVDYEEDDVEGTLTIPVPKGDVLNIYEFGLYHREDGTREIEIFREQDTPKELIVEQYVRKNV